MQCQFLQSSKKIKIEKGLLDKIIRASLVLPGEVLVKENRDFGIDKLVGIEKYKCQINTHNTHTTHSQGFEYNKIQPYQSFLTSA